MGRAVLVLVLTLVGVGVVQAEDRFVILWYYAKIWESGPSAKLKRDAPRIDRQASILDTATGHGFQCHASFSQEKDKSWVDEDNGCIDEGMVPGALASGHKTYAIEHADDHVAQGTVFSRINQDKGTIAFCFRAEKSYVCSPEIKIGM